LLLLMMMMMMTFMPTLIFADDDFAFYDTIYIFKVLVYEILI